MGVDFCMGEGTYTIDIFVSLKDIYDKLICYGKVN